MIASLNVLISFNGTDGASPYSSLITDANGDLFGTTGWGGDANYWGTVFEIVKTATGYASTPTTLINFNGSDGACPFGSLMVDASGDLLGTTDQSYVYGPSPDDGLVFKIGKTANGYANAPSALVSFSGADGACPEGHLIADPNGDLFGTTSGGGANGDGTVFEIANTATGYASTPTTLVSFDGTNGNIPHGSLIADASGDLFGMTLNGGTYNAGTVFEIVRTGAGYASAPTTLFSFDGTFDDTGGGCPWDSLIADANGDLFGTTDFGGPNGSGTVFEIAKTATGYASTPTTLVAFNNADGGVPKGSLIADANGDLFGTTNYGGTSNDGTVFEVVKTADGYASTPITLISFDGTNGQYPEGTLFADANGDLFGTTVDGGANGDGTVFEITGSGFVPRVPAPNDFTGNGTSDILFRDPTSGALSDFLISGGQPTWAAIGWADPSLHLAGTGDFNGDGTSDILFSDPTSGTLSEFVMINNQPTWQPLGWAATNWQVAGIGDFTGNGTDDILFRDPTTGGLGDFLMSNGQPTWASIGWADPSLQVVGVGNFNGGATSDILFRDPTSGALSEFAMQNNQPTWTPIGWAATNWQVVGVGDFNGDGTDDILFRDPTTGALGDFLMNNGQATWQPVGWADPSLQVVGVGDCDGDGASDIVFRDPGTGALGMFAMHDNQPTWAGVGVAATNWHVAD